MPYLLVLEIDHAASVAAVAEKAATVVREGGIVAFPTDTVYGLACDPWNRRALASLFRLKRRPDNKPILLLIDEIERVESLAVGIPEVFRSVSQKFSPGPLTYVLRASPSLPEELTGGTGKIGLRLPEFNFARQFASRCGGAITATSANVSGLQAAKSARDVEAQLGRSVDLLIDGGESKTTFASTVLDFTTHPPSIIREGAVPGDQIRPVLDGAPAS